MAYNQERQQFITFTSNGSDKLMDAVQLITFSSEPDFLGQREYFNPIGFFLHPGFDDGAEFIVTLDYQAVLENELAGYPMSEEVREELLT